MSPALAKQSSKTLASCERVIADGLRTFVEVGRALAQIRDEELYKAEHSTFEAYCKARWDLSRTRAYELIGSADVVSAIADTELPSPANEAQCRPLAKLPEAEQPKAWAEAVRTAPDGIITAKHVASVVAKRMPERKPAQTVAESSNTFDVPPEAVEPRSEPRTIAPRVDVIDDDFGPPSDDQPPPGCIWKCGKCATWYPADVEDCPECDEQEPDDDIEFNGDVESGRLYRWVHERIDGWPPGEPLDPLLAVLRQLVSEIEKRRSQ